MSWTENLVPLRVELLFSCPLFTYDAAELMVEMESVSAASAALEADRLSLLFMMVVVL